MAAFYACSYIDVATFEMVTNYLVIFNGARKKEYKPFVYNRLPPWQTGHARWELSSLGGNNAAQTGL
jgi:hypothetical protein